jgi:hypothetical protein
MTDQTNAPGLTIDDRRTDDQRRDLWVLVIGTDEGLSGWGLAEGGKSYAAWACHYDDYQEVYRWVDGRGDMSRVRVVFSPTYRPDPRVCAHLAIYPVTPDHPALPGSHHLRR